MGKFNLLYYLAECFMNVLRRLFSDENFFVIPFFSPKNFLLNALMVIMIFKSFFN